MGNSDLLKPILILYVGTIGIGVFLISHFYISVWNIVSEDGHFLVDLPASEELINKLPVIIYEPYLNLWNKSCPICLVEYEAGDSLKNLPGCNHTFHNVCIDEWLKRKWNCPFCWVDIWEEDVDNYLKLTDE